MKSNESHHKRRKLDITYQKRPTLKDVSKYAGVSIGTVERALQNQGRISDETKEKVLNAVKALDYRPNTIAQSLRRQAKYKILALYHTTPDYFTSSFTYGFKAAIEELMDFGVSLRIVRSMTLDPQDALSALSTIEISKFDALLINAGGPELDNFINSTIDHGIPVATFGSDSPTSKRLFFVGENHYLAGQLSGELIAQLMGGIGNVFLFSGLTSVYALKERIHGFKDVLSSDFPQIHLTRVIEHSDDDEIAYTHAVQVLLEKSLPDAIFCNSATGTMALHRAIIEHNIKMIPLIIGYDFNKNIYEMLQNYHCSATIFQHPFMQAYNALYYIYRYLNNNTIPKEAQSYIPTKIVFKYNSKECLQESKIYEIY